MTREEILALEAGRELDVLIAEKVEGAIVFEYGSRLCYASDEDAVERAMSGSGLFIEFDEPPQYAWDLPNYSFNAGSALDLVRLLGHPWFYLSNESIGQEWRHLEAPKGGWVACFGSAEGKNTATADTAALAICRAALLAVNDKEV